MLVRIKWTIRQFEWYRDNKDFYYRLKQQLEAVFCVMAMSRAVENIYRFLSCSREKKPLYILNHRAKPATERQRGARRKIEIYRLFAFEKHINQSK